MSQLLTAEPPTCPRHGALMQVVPEPNRRMHAPLHRCAECTIAFRAAWSKALALRGSGNKAKDRAHAS